MTALADAVTGLSHIGIRVHDLARSRAFYERLGFAFRWGPFGPEQVVGMRHGSGLEINLIVNAPDEAAPNVLMDVPHKHAGFTHVALAIRDVAQTEAALAPRASRFRAGAATALCSCAIRTAT